MTLRFLCPWDHLYRTNIIKEQWNEIDRWNGAGPHYSEYTGCSLKYYFCYFWVILFLHVIVNILVKLATSKPFRNCGSLLEMVVHGIENCNMPTIFRDWDLDKGSMEAHKKKHFRVLVEMNLMILIRAVFHAIMIIPILNTGKNMVQ